MTQRQTKKVSPCRGWDKPTCGKTRGCTYVSGQKRRYCRSKRGLLVRSKPPMSPRTRKWREVLAELQPQRSLRTSSQKKRDKKKAGKTGKSSHHKRHIAKRDKAYMSRKKAEEKKATRVSRKASKTQKRRPRGERKRLQQLRGALATELKRALTATRGVQNRNFISARETIDSARSKISSSTRKRRHSSAGKTMKGGEEGDVLKCTAPGEKVMSKKDAVVSLENMSKNAGLPDQQKSLMITYFNNNEIFSKISQENNGCVTEDLVKKFFKVVWENWVVPSGYGSGVQLYFNNYTGQWWQNEGAGGKVPKKFQPERRSYRPSIGHSQKSVVVEEEGPIHADHSVSQSAEKGLWKKFQNFRDRDLEKKKFIGIYDGSYPIVRNMANVVNLYRNKSNKSEISLTDKKRLVKEANEIMQKWGPYKAKSEHCLQGKNDGGKVLEVRRPQRIGHRQDISRPPRFCGQESCIKGYGLKARESYDVHCRDDSADNKCGCWAIKYGQSISKLYNKLKFANKPFNNMPKTSWEVGDKGWQIALRLAVCNYIKTTDSRADACRNVESANAWEQSNQKSKDIKQLQQQHRVSEVNQLFPRQ